MHPLSIVMLFPVMVSGEIPFQIKTLKD